MALSDGTLINRSIDGDNEAFRELVDRYKSLVYNRAWQLLGDHGEAEDAAQETFLRLYKNLKRYQPQFSFRSWLYRITNVAGESREKAYSRPCYQRI